MFAALQPVPHSCRRFSLGRDCKTAAIWRTSDAGAGPTGPEGSATYAGEPAQGAGAKESGAGLPFQAVGRRFWGSRGWFSCAGRSLSWARFSFSGEVVPSPVQDFHFPAQEGRSLAQEVGVVLQTAGLWPRRTVLRPKIFIFLRGRIVPRLGGADWCSRLALSGPRFSFSCTGEPAPCTGETISGQGRNPSKPFTFNPFYL